MAKDEAHSSALLTGDGAAGGTAHENGDARPTVLLTASEQLEDEGTLFEGLMRQVGQKGPFQTRLNWTFNFLFVVFISMPYLNVVLSLSVPEHWCHVPGRELTNYTEDQWKALTLPRNGTANSDEDGFDNCRMFEYNASGLSVAAGAAATTGGGPAVVDCQHGWDYDHTWYKETAPSQQNWVCDRAIYVSNVFAFSRGGDVLGCFIFGQLGDTWGRRPIFLVTLVMLLLGRTLSVLAVGMYPLFLIATVLGSASSSAAFQSPFTVGMEVSAGDKRGHIAMLQGLGWTLGCCAVPLVAWACGHWVILIVVTTLPCLPFMLLHRYFPESPRWLAGRGQTGRCREVLAAIARANGTTLPPETDETLERIASRRERVFGVASLFSSYRLAKNTALIAYAWFVNSVTYYTLMLSVSTLSGNPFLNYFWQSLVELPGSVVGQVLSDRYGRRWTQAGCFYVLTGAYIALVSVIADSNLSWLTTLLVIFAKFCVSITFYVIYLQCMEIYPTCVRQTGTALASLVGSGLGIIGPYILYMGEDTDVRYPYIIMSFLAATGGFCSSFLPETLHQQLPETLADAHRFGHDQHYWQFRYKPRKQASKEEQYS